MNSSVNHLAAALNITEDEAQEIVVAYAIYTKYGIDFVEVGRGPVRMLACTMIALFALTGRIRRNRNHELAGLIYFAKAWTGRCPHGY